MVRADRRRVNCLLAAGLVLVGVGAACSGNDEPSDLRGVEVDVDVSSESGPNLPTVSSGDAVLPTVKAPDGDSVDVPTTTTSTLPPTTSTSTTTTTLPPTTTTTIPPPVIPSDVLFDAGSAELSPEAAPYLTDLANEITGRYPGARLTFVGHTDSRGSEAANLVLSQDRARAVMNWFAQAGYSSDRMAAEGRGESEMLVLDTDAGGAFVDSLGQQNRRVEILIDPA